MHIVGAGLVTFAHREVEFMLGVDERYGLARDYALVQQFTGERQISNTSHVTYRYAVHTVHAEPAVFLFAYILFMQTNKI